MKNKLISVALFLFIAMALWLYVITTVSPGSKETYYNIPVVLANESVLTERGLMITTSPPPRRPWCFPATGATCPRWIRAI